MKIEDIEAFVAVVHAQSISAAAALLQLTQPSITRRVQNLEEGLGVELLDRHTKPPRPNAMGREVYGQCRAVLREVDALRELAAHDTRASGGLRLGVTQGLGDLLLPGGLALLRAQWPALTLQISTGWGSQLLQRIDQGELDAACALLPATHPLPREVQGDKLGSMRLVVVGARGALAKARPKLADCAPLGWVLNPDGCGFRAGLQRELAGRGLKLVLRLETFGRELQLQMVAEGLGLGLVPERFVDSSVHGQQLEVIAVADFKPTVDLWLLKGRQLGKLGEPVQAFGQHAAVALGLARR